MCITSDFLYYLTIFMYVVTLHSPPKLQYPETCFLKKDTVTIEDEKLFRPCRSVHLSVPQSHYKSGTPTQSVKISTLYHNFLIHYCRDFSHILHIYTRPLVDYLVSELDLDLS